MLLHGLSVRAIVDGILLDIFDLGYYVQESVFAWIWCSASW